MDLTPSVLENPHVRLEPLMETHRSFLRPLADDPKIWELATLRGDGERFDNWFDLMLNSQDFAQQISHAVFSKTANAYAGHSAYLAINNAHARVEIGWTWYAAAFRGGVTNPACKHLLLKRAFDAGAERVELKTHHLNIRSQRAMEKLGATQEGVLRSHLPTWTGERRDTVFYSVLKPEWPRVEKGLLDRID